MDDATLVARAIAGDVAAFASLYDRYAGAVYGLSVRMLRDTHEAADVTSEVFLIAAERLSQLREPSKVRAWLLAVARNEVHRVMRHRRRVTPEEGFERLADDASDTLDLSGHDPDASRLAVVHAANGLDDRDRMVLELTIAGLQGDELSAALGVTTSNAYQMTHRMKERLERSIGALFVARQGRSDCELLDQLLADWDGTFSVTWRKRVARHVDRCEVCERTRRKVPAAVLSGTAFAGIPAAFAVTPPEQIRVKVVDGASHRLGAQRPDAWPDGGWPPASGGPPSTRRWLAAAAIVALLVGVGVLVARWGQPSERADVTAAGSDSPTALPTAPVPSNPTIATQEPHDGPTVPVDSTDGPEPSIDGQSSVAPSGPPIPTVSALPGPPVDQESPQVQLSGPEYLIVASCIPPYANEPFVVGATDDIGIARVEVQWRIQGVTTTAAAIKSGDSWRHVVNPDAGDQGSVVTVTAVVFDAAGNRATSNPIVAQAVDCLL